MTDSVVKEGLAWANRAMWLYNNWQPVALVLVLVVLLNVFVLLKRRVRKPFLKPDTFQPLRLVEKKYITHNTARFCFVLPYPDQRLGLPIGQHITFLAKDDEGKDVYRAYTPTSDDDQLGSVDFVIKIYPQGKMSQILAKLKVGETMLMKGPKGRFTYTPNMKAHIGMLAGGTGVTPMYQVLNAILKDPKDTTRVSLVFGNLTENDILLRNELDDLERMHAGRLSITHVLNDPPVGWAGEKGFITENIIRRHLPPPGPDVLVLRCGPLPMMNAMKDILDKVGYDEDAQFQF